MSILGVFASVVNGQSVQAHIHRPQPSADVTAPAAAIDRLVYGLYGLTAAEIKIVEGA